MTGRTVYAGLIDAYSHYGLPAEAEEPPGEAPSSGPRSWNPQVRPERDAAAMFRPDPAGAGRLRGAGFTSALIVPAGGIFKGTSALVSLGEGTANSQIVLPQVAQHIRLGPSGSDTYPASLMGAIALIRQTLLDADWYRRAQEAHTKDSALVRPETDRSLEALAGIAAGRERVMIEADDELNALRADAIAREFKLRLLLRGSGSEYRRLEAISATGWPIILPLDFAPAPAVSSPEQALQVSLRSLRAWDEEPENPARLHGAGMTIAFGSEGLAKPELLLARARAAVRRGLAPDAALAALTITPATLFGAERILGTLEPGKRASVIITDGDLFAESTHILECWVDGNRYPTDAFLEIDPRGAWLLSMPGGSPGDSTVLEIGGEPARLSARLKRDLAVVCRDVSLAAFQLTFAVSGDSLAHPGMIRMSATVYDTTLQGRGEWPDGSSFTWSANRIRRWSAPEKKQRDSVAMASFPPVRPYGAFGRRQLPDRPALLLVTGATIWTSGPEGVIANGDLLVRDGQIAAVGRGLTRPAGALVIDASGKHITPGLIDAHSHMGISGAVNEATQAVTAEVRIGDVIDSDDISLYRALAGGLTIAHSLHGSANPIGGQSQVIKLRWGMLPEQMKFTDAAPTIKFALGENVKQSNWGEKYTTRYPQTRMGVEQIMRDAFRAALDYAQVQKAYHDNPRGIPPRRDLELDALLEVLRGTRMIHCHSYRQDEILATMRLAEEFGFRIAVFQHVLEGYKVASEMAEHGAAGSSFTDWWAYKIEVYDAIPDNGAIMHDQGVLVTFNSDSDELARRMNLEAAKAVKYGGLSEEEALKFVTINAARQLRAEARVGSLEAGKDADFVIWSGPPLSTFSRCEQTWIEGRRYFDLQENRELNAEVAHQRIVLTQKILSGVNRLEGDGSATSRSDSREDETHYSCTGGEAQ
jgi:imidazolonepropionase-like amidohydrolase